MKSILKNIKTTIFGSIAGIPTIIDGVHQHNLTHILAGLGALLLGLFAKDHNNSYN